MRLALFALCLVSRMSLGVIAVQQCKPSEAAVHGKALKGHTFKRSVVRAPFECQVLCESELTCQSYNYFLRNKICEINSRTKEARPDDFVTDENSFYMRSWPNRVPLGSIPEMPAESCMEIDASEEGTAVSGKYWMNNKEMREVAGIASMTFPVYCDMTPGSQGWTLIARFSNNDAKQWMNDSGYWWYDRTDAAGETTGPSNNTDMISPAFWSVSGNELKITRSDDTQHTPLLQTTGNCLGVQTFRSKVTSYGDFRNGVVWANEQCLGSCTVQHGGQYQTTDGFNNAKCNGSIQTGDRIGFWCRYVWSGSVLMIGGGGPKCTGTDHGIGITVAKSVSFVTEPGRREYDFGSSGWGYRARNYALNLWIR